MDLSEKEVRALGKRLAELARPTQAKLTPEQRVQLVRDFLSGATVQEVADKYGITRQTASYHLKKHIG